MPMTLELENQFAVLVSIDDLGGQASKEQVLKNIDLKGYYQFDRRDFQLREKGEEIWRNNLAQTRRHLVTEKHLDGSEYDNWRITDEGMRWLVALAIVVIGGRNDLQKLTEKAVERADAIFRASLPPSERCEICNTWTQDLALHKRLNHS